MHPNKDPNITATTILLKLLNVKVNTSSIRNTLQNHPNWPSLLCISDALTKWKVPNSAIKTTPDQLENIPTPFMTYTTKQEIPTIVKAVNIDSVELILKTNGKSTIQNREQFQKDWQGICLLAESTASSGEKNYTKLWWKNRLQTSIPVLLITVIFASSIHLLIARITNSSTIYQDVSYLYSVLLFGGFTTTILLLKYEIGENNPFLEAVCSSFSKGNCKAILTSKASKIMNLISWSEIGLFFYAGGILTLLLLENTTNNAITIIGISHLLALPYVAYSLYYQGVIVKQWCLLCLTIQLLLLTGGICAITSNIQSTTSSFPFPLMLKTLLIYSTPILFWYSLKPWIINLQEGEKTKKELFAAKYNIEFFENLLHKQKKNNLSINGLGITLGNPKATNQLIKVCNPYCTPCAKAHPKIEKLLEDNDNIKAQIIFTTSNNKKEHAYQATNHLLAIAAQPNNTNHTKGALRDWYQDQNKDYPTFAEKHPFPKNTKEQGEKIEAMDRWCQNIGIEYTPTYFFNNYQLPQLYNIEDLQHLV